MRIVAVADTHTFEADLPPIPDGDVFVHAGDMTRRGSLDEMEVVARWVTTLPHRHKVIVAGNHDWCFVRARTYAERLFTDCHYLQDSAVAIEGVNFWGSPWQPEFNDWAFNLPRGKALAQKWALIAANTDVLITHGPPKGYGDAIATVERSGCADLLASVRQVQPRLHMFGHIHQDGGMFTDSTNGEIAYANVTTWECERPPTVIDFDLATKTVTPISIPPAGRDQ